ncbi:MAG: hypothetical protein IKJ77_01960 [Firmicutes bacterium]|nr:hypothetical protein [Bacillota bacterium]
MFDWNGNGREDWGDRYIDYQIYNDIYHGDEEESGGNQPSGGDGAGCGCLSPVIMFVLVFFIWNIIFN